MQPVSGCARTHEQGRAGALHSGVIDVIGAPFDLCGKRTGSRLGPAAIRLADLIATLHSVGLDAADCGDILAGQEHRADGGLRNFRPLLEFTRNLRARVLESLRSGRVPLILGGEHTLAAGSISAALEHFAGDVGLLWIDAHADVNTPGSTSSGNLHGMPLAALAGLPSGAAGQLDAEWRDLLAALGAKWRLNLESTVWFGLRDVDAGERGRLSGFSVTMHDIDRHGIAVMIARVDNQLRGTGVRHVWVSFDVDALDPVLAPGTGTGVRGGLSYREAHLTAELIREALDATDCPYRLAGVDLVEVNPLSDSQNETAKIAVEWLSSLFGKTILGTR